LKVVLTGWVKITTNKVRGKEEKSDGETHLKDWGSCKGG